MREINGRDAEVLRLFCGYPQDMLDAVFPPELEQTYWDFRAAASRAGIAQGTNFMDETLLSIFMMSGAKRPGMPLRTWADDAKDGHVMIDETCVVWFRGDLADGRFKCLQANGYALIEVDGHDREFAVHRVWYKSEDAQDFLQEHAPRKVAQPPTGRVKETAKT